MSPLALGLILLGSATQILGIVYFAVLAETFQALPMFVAISVGSAIEAAGVLIMIRQRQ